MNDMTLTEWLQYGIDKGYCSDSVCATHNGLPDTEEEMQEWEDGGDPCIPAVRIWFNE
jgi:hypothetical protein